MAKTAKKFWNKQDEKLKVRKQTYVCCLCEKVKSLSLSKAFFGYWHVDPDTDEMVVVCHHCEADEEAA
jgi:transcription elongation factor Elf1